MATKISQFLIGISTDPKKRDEFKNNPDAVMDAAGLSPQEKAALKTGHPERIQSHLDDDDPPGVMVVIAI